jgi:hypothetical protein
MRPEGSPAEDAPGGPSETELKLRKALMKVREALRPFAKLADEVNGKDTDYVPCSMLCGDFNHARTTLRETRT